jgi:hypothetical protein
MMRPLCHGHGWSLPPSIQSKAVAQARSRSRRAREGEGETANAQDVNMSYRSNGGPLFFTQSNRLIYFKTAHNSDAEIARLFSLSPA